MCSSPAPPFLPDVLIAEILSFLDVKSIMRLRCVCKFWNTLIFDSTFVNLHLNKSAKQNPHFLLITSHSITVTTEFQNGSYSFTECEQGIIPYSVSSLLENPSFALSVDSHHLVQDKGCSYIVGSCNGLVCFAGETVTMEYYEFWFRLWNPATRTTSPRLGFFRLFRYGPDCTSSADDGYYKFNFGYDNSTGTYKTVASRYNRRQLRSNVRVLSFGDHVWRDIQSFPVDPMYLDYSAYETCGNVGVYFKSTINWLAIQNHFTYDSYNIKDISVEQFVIVSLDLRTEAYNKYLLPCEFDEVPPVAPTIGVLGDCLCFSYCYKETDFIIWQMNKFGVQDSWTQFLKISYHNLQIDYDYSDEDMKYNFELVPLFLSKDGDTLVLESSQEHPEILYNWRNGRVERTKITATTTITDDRAVHLVSCTALDYFESLVSVF
ncbi:F-box/kelch-repeat protein At3g23880-like [Vicia villosa]|uniref:F-box/kelch-repeat protein At3g23880-like n=1 Tax=Vicia villosa TaxID=3911 RepID=UPI00273C0A5B|nr:F-box/kelch-repeat protein At3g23880-like [Vicia villosa]XP_058779737.1 F-box/kelch-repeat protein At3g23880-like [Vicia villosa]XP_058779738.1 F-box/kelch-repeat protein At3g23880-like [Vicia villosa]XP_058779739.1 F-box/kelch-repeat protein At3g23880-like [Vicia villosa]